jgi:putative membrane protein
MIRSFVAGLCIGIANIIPGVSGGTLAVILGIYDKLIQSISTIIKTPFSAKKEFQFILPILIGAVCAVKLGASLIQYFLQVYPNPTYWFFIGLILGSLPIIFKQHSNMTLTLPKAIAFLIPLVLMIALSISEPPSTTSTSSASPLLLFLSGSIAAGTMIIPGISGSFMLLLIGTYPLIIEAVSTLNFRIIAIVGAGAIIGLILVTKLITLTLKKYPALTYYTIIGFLIGSIPTLYPGNPQTMLEFLQVIPMGIGYLLAKNLGSGTK